MFNFFSKKNTDENTNAKEMAKRLEDGTFTLDDFATQLAMMDKLEKLRKVARFIPGMGKKLEQLSPEAIARGKKELEVFKKIIAVMSVQERAKPHMLSTDRKQHIAAKAGVSVQLIDEMLQKFEQTKQFVKMFKSTGKMPNF